MIYYIAIAVFFLIISWSLNYGLSMSTEYFQRKVTFLFLPLGLQEQNLQKRYINFMNFTMFILYIIVGSILLLLNSDTIDSLFYYVDLTKDIFLIIPPICAYTSVLGFVILVFYVQLRFKSEEQFNIVRTGKWYTIFEIVEAFFWWGIFYHILASTYYQYNVLLALGVSLVYAFVILSQYFHILLKKMMPVYIFVHSFLSMFFCCILLTLTENVIMPMLFATVLLYFLKNKWSIVFPKIKFLNKQS